MRNVDVDVVTEQFDPLGIVAMDSTFQLSLHGIPLTVELKVNVGVSVVDDNLQLVAWNKQYVELLDDVLTLPPLIAAPNAEIADGSSSMGVSHLPPACSHMCRHYTPKTQRLVTECCLRRGQRSRMLQSRLRPVGTSGSK